MNLSLALLLLGQIIAISADPTPTITEYLLISISEFPASTVVVSETLSYYNSEWTSTNTITLPASPTDPALKTLRTFTDVSYSSKSGITIAYVVLFTGIITPATTFPTPVIPTTPYSDPVNPYTSIPYTAYGPTIYAVPITYYPWPTCSPYKQTWTYSTDVIIPFPTYMSSSYVPLSTGVSYITPPDIITPVTTHTSSVHKILLNPSDLKPDGVFNASVINRPYWILGCYTPTTICDATPASTTAVQRACRTSFVPDPKVPRPKSESEVFAQTILTIILLGSVFPGGWLLLFFCIGIFESRRQFGKAMKGLECRLGFPYTWGCVCICCFCLPRRRYVARSREDRARLTENWKNLGFSGRSKLWFKRGLSPNYPVDLLGPRPEKKRDRWRKERPANGDVPVAGGGG